MSSLLLRVIRAHRCRSTHHHIAINALSLIKGEHAERWHDLMLVLHQDLLSGAKAPDTDFKDFKNHVLHISEGEWGGARDAAAEWYGKAVMALKAKRWSDAVYALGVMSHYYADPIQPFHTGQTEEEGAMHRALEWSIAKSHGELERRIQAKGYPEVPTGEGVNFVSGMVRAGAEVSHPHYQTLIDHYNLDVGVKSPEDGLDETLLEIISDLIAYATSGLAAIFDRAFAEAAVKPPKSNLTLNGFLATLDIPVRWITKKLDDAGDRRIVEAMYKELRKTGKVIKALPDDDKAIRKMHAQQVLRMPLKELDAQRMRKIGTKHVARNSASQVAVETSPVRDEPVIDKKALKQKQAEEAKTAKAARAAEEKAAQEAKAKALEAEKAEKLRLAEAKKRQDEAEKQRLAEEKQREIEAEKAAKLKAEEDAKRQREEKRLAELKAKEEKTKAKLAKRTAKEEAEAAEAIAALRAANATADRKAREQAEIEAKALEQAAEKHSPAKPKIKVQADMKPSEQTETSAEIKTKPDVSSEPIDVDFEPLEDAKLEPEVPPRTPAPEPKVAQKTEAPDEAEDDLVDEDELLKSSRRGSLTMASPIVDAPSIGKKTAARLNKVGINTTGDLIQANTDKLAERLNSRYMTSETLTDWQDQTLLMIDMPSLRVHDAQILVGAGVRCVEDLAEASASDLLKAATTFLKSPKGSRLADNGTEVDQEEIYDWIEEAQAAFA